MLEPEEVRQAVEKRQESELQWERDQLSDIEHNYLKIVENEIENTTLDPVLSPSGVNVFFSKWEYLKPQQEKVIDLLAYYLQACGYDVKVDWYPDNQYLPEVEIKIYWRQNKSEKIKK